MSLKTKILSTEDLKIESLLVPEWDTEVQLKQWSGRVRAAFQLWYEANKNSLGDLSALVCTMSIVDEQGLLVFTKDDVSSLNDKSSTALDRVAIHVFKMNGLNEQAIEAAKKNS